jgi:hypothetical protein
VPIITWISVASRDDVLYGFWACSSHCIAHSCSLQLLYSSVYWSLNVLFLLGRWTHFYMFIWNLRGCFFPIC